MQNPNNRLIGQTCLVTGSSSGIGQAVAKSMASEGANIIINYNNNKQGAEETAHDISKQPLAGSVIIQQADVSDEISVKKMYKNALDKFKYIDVCVLNAGIQKDAPLHEMSLEDWNKVINVNLTGQFLCARESLNHFMKVGIRKGVSLSAGKIIHMSSVHDIIPWSGHANYAAAKGGLTMLMQSICQGYAQYKIRCNSIAPGATRTNINKDVWSSKQGLKDMLKLIPYNEVGEPQQIANVASWLASDESEYINGTTIYVDGGMTCYPGFTTNG
ncbi:MAG: SDR family oxidoreductase [Psychroserpens sp.]|uniref:SDR family oxidoreductase n=1 Tax=Psychroserpens sp. TaxID=2020870 RepID=UPI003C99B8B5